MATSYMRILPRTDGGACICRQYVVFSSVEVQLLCGNSGAVGLVRGPSRARFGFVISAMFGSHG